MMQFTKIDINNWTRKEYFDHYFDNTPCTYSMTVKLDISKLKKDGKKLYPTLLYHRASEGADHFAGAAAPAIHTEAAEGGAGAV